MFATLTCSYPASIQDEFLHMRECSNDTIPVFNEQNMLFRRNPGKTQPELSIMGYRKPTSYNDNSNYESLSVENNFNGKHTSNMVSRSFSASQTELKPLPSSNPDSSKTHNCPLYTSIENNNSRTMQPHNLRLCPAPCLGPPSNRELGFQSLHRSLALGTRHPRRKGIHTLSTVPSNIRVQREPKNECEWAGCSKRFQRQEHLKRHQRTHTQADSFVCQFCEKVFGRSDNFKSHTKLHTTRTPRTQYFLGAQKVYDRMNQKSLEGRRRKQSANQV